MPYVVTTIDPDNLQKINLNSFLLSGKVTVRKIQAKRRFNLTKWYNKSPELSGFDVSNMAKMMGYVRQISRRRLEINMNYRHFTIPKKTGGERPIDEPNPELKAVQATLKEKCIDNVMDRTHTAAFAYCKDRSTKLCRMRHQANKSNWFLHLDLHHFFNSLTHPWVMNQIRSIYPYSELEQSQFDTFKDAMLVCWLDGGLPQGTVISPALSNLCMIPFDCELNKRLATKGFVYTRYADDIEISHQKWFDAQEIIKTVEEVMAKLDAPFTLNREKTHYGSRAGRNWGLGLMLNKDNQITIGHEKKRLLKAELHHLLCDWKTMLTMENNADKTVKADEIRKKAIKLQGKLAYLRYIEPKYGEYMQTHLEEKIGVSLKTIIKFYRAFNYQTTFRMEYGSLFTF